ncbi:MAG: CPXCG motif-containing cysteine-rich protein [Sandaracinaceae bacterium]
MDDSVSIQCPWCGEEVSLYVEMETAGSMVEDCEVCCRPWQLFIEHGEDGEPRVSVQRA